MTEKPKDRQKLFMCLLLYFLGMVILAVGLTLNTKETLGAAAIIGTGRVIALFNRLFGDKICTLF